MTNKYWTKQWNFLEGCTPVGREGGCRFCWAESMAHRFGKYWGIPKVNLDILEHGIKNWRNPQIVFICNTSDLFHEAVNMEIISKAFEQMWRNSKHTYLILTKRPDKLVEFLSYYFTPDITPIIRSNCWLGATVENQLQADIRIPKLLSCGKKWNYWLSIEPMLSEINLRPEWLKQIKSVVIGMENAGKESRFVPNFYINDVCRQLHNRSIPFFIKQRYENWSDKLQKYEYQGNLFKRK